MKKIISVVVGLIVLLGGGWWYQSTLVDDQSIPVQVASEDNKKQVELVVDFGDVRNSYIVDLPEEMDVLGLLMAMEKTHEIVVEKYDFGSLVVSIDGRENTKEKSWIYFLNGNSGEVGADQKIITNGDVVEWKYIAPIF